MYLKANIVNITKYYRDNHDSDSVYMICKDTI